MGSGIGREGSTELRFLRKRLRVCTPEGGLWRAPLAAPLAAGAWAARGGGGQSRKGEVALDTGLGGDRRLDLWVQMSVSLFTVSHHPYPGLVST